MDLAAALRTSAQGSSRDARVWERCWAPIFWTFAVEILRRARLRGGMAVLDVGCGTGLATLLAARPVDPEGRVVGIDQAPGVLQGAREKALEAKLRNVSFCRANAVRLDLPAASFNRGTSNSGIGTWAAPWALEEAHRPYGRSGRTVIPWPMTCFTATRASPPT